MNNLMSYIHERDAWPNFTWDGDALAPALARVRHKQGRQQGRLEAAGVQLRSEASLATLTEEVVKSSAIEGERLGVEEVRSSIARKLGIEAAGLPVPSQRVEGVVDMTLDATRNFDRPLTAQRLFGWHRRLFPTGRNAMGSVRVGDWRRDERGPMEVVSGSIGKERIHFRAPAATRLADEMTAFLSWFAAPPPMDPLVRAGVAHLWFVTIHPFDDGNGRIGRAIVNMALSQADGTGDRYYSMSSGIEAERKAYYFQLESAQRGNLDITSWLAWFIECLDQTLDAAERSLSTVFAKARFWQELDRQPINDRQRKVLNRMLDDFKGHLTTSKYAKLAKCSSDSALRDIKDLLQRQIIVKNPGAGRNTSYRLRAPLDADS